MGRLTNAVASRYGGAREMRNAPPPVYTLSGTMASEYFNRRRDAEFGVTETRQRIQDHLAGLSTDELDMLYLEAVDGSSDMGLVEFQDKVMARDNDGSWMEAPPFGSDGVEKMAAALERYYQDRGKPEKIDQLAESIETFPPMSDPGYPPEEKYVYPVSAKIEEIKNSLPPEQQTEENIRLLEQVNEESKLLSRKYFSHLQLVGKDKLPVNEGVENANINGMEYFADHVIYGYIDEYFQTEGKQYAKLVEPVKQTNALYPRTYKTETNNSRIAPEFMKHIPEMEKLETGVTEETLQDIQSVADDIDSLGPDAYPFAEFHHAVYKTPKSEMGDKAYALTPMRAARKDLEKAVNTGDMEMIRQAHEKYQNVKKVMDHMAETARTKPEKGQSEVYEGNMDYMRGSGTGDIPEEYIKDFAGHSKLASVLVLNNYAKYAGVSVKDIIKNPVATAIKATDKYLNDYGIQSGKTTGAKLTLALSNDHAGMINQAYGLNVGGCIHRSIEGVAGFAHSREEAVSIVGQAALARGAAFGRFSDEIEQWMALANSPEEKKQRLYELTILMPEDQLAMEDMPKRFAKKTWKTDLGTDRILKGAMAKGDYDYEGLIAKADRIAEEAYAEAERLNDEDSIYTEYDPKAFRKASVTAFRKVLEAAPEKDRNSPGYLKLQAEVERRAMEMEPKEAEENLVKQIVTLTGEALTLPFNSEDPAAYRKMMNSLKDLQMKKRLIRGDTEGISPEDRERLKNVSLDDAIRTARSDTAAYSRKVEESGRKAGVSYQSGADRAIEALDRMRREDLDAQIAILDREKTGLFVSRENSAEHQQMMRSLKDLQTKRRLLRGDTEGISPAEQERLKKISLDKAIRTARNDTMAYSRKVEEDGKKTSFRYTSGAERANAATHAVEALDRLADATGGRTPVQQMEDMLQRDTMDSRTDAEQVISNAATSLYVNFIKNNPEKFTPEVQESLLSRNKLKEAVDIFKKDQAFQKMVKTLGTGKLADQVINGPDSVLTSYLDAQKALDPQNVAKSGSEMTREERDKYMKKADFDPNREEKEIEV